MFGSVSTVYLRTDGCPAPDSDQTDIAGSARKSKFVRRQEEGICSDADSDAATYSGSDSQCDTGSASGSQSGNSGFCIDLIIRGDTIEQVLDTSQVSTSHVKWNCLGH